MLGSFFEMARGFLYLLVMCIVGTILFTREQDIYGSDRDDERVVSSASGLGARGDAYGEVPIQREDLASSEAIEANADDSL